jgi:ADP-ribosylglycohydrolase
MRLAPVPLFFAERPWEAIEKSGASSQTTHGAAAAVDGCRYLGALLVGAVAGVDKERLLANRYTPVPDFWQEYPLVPEIDAIAAGSFKRKKPPAIKGSGYVVESLEAALWVFYQTDTFRDGVLLAANLGNDADTTAAVYGQLAGAFYGEAEIPAGWRRLLALRETILELATSLYKLRVQAGSG